MISIPAVISIIVLGCTAPSYTHDALPWGKKPVPVITLKNLTPPYKNYDYLQGNETFGFQYDATGFSLINAWWLAEMSTLVYADEEFVRSQLKRVGLNTVKFFDKLSTQCYVASNDKFAIVAFRGSEIWKKRKTLDINEAMADLKTDIDIRRVDWPQGGKVHRGFWKALEEVWSDLLPYMRYLESEGCKIWITGHSLGGALAVLSGALYPKARGVYTYGAPWVGDEKFSANLSTKVFRFVNGEDIVARIPSFGIFVHVGELKLIDNDGILRNTALEGEPTAKQLLNETNANSNSPQPRKNSSIGFIPAPFRDHVPLLYAVYLWNNLIVDRK